MKKYCSKSCQNKKMSSSKKIKRLFFTYFLNGTLVSKKALFNHSGTISKVHEKKLPLYFLEEIIFLSASLSCALKEASSFKVGGFNPATMTLPGRPPNYSKLLHLQFNGPRRQIGFLAGIWDQVVRQQVSWLDNLRPSMLPVEPY